MTRFLLISTLLFACTKPLPVEAPQPEVAVTRTDLRVQITLVSNKGSLTTEMVVAQDGTFTATVTDAGRMKTTKAGKVTTGELFDDTGKLRAKIDDDNTVVVLHENERRHNGVLVETTEMWMNIGTFDAEGTFTARMNGEKTSVGADGTLVGWPWKTVTNARTAEEKRTAIFLAIATMAGGKTTMDAQGPVSYPAAPVPEMTD